MSYISHEIDSFFSTIVMRDEDVRRRNHCQDLSSQIFNNGSCCKGCLSSQVFDSLPDAVNFSKQKIHNTNDYPDLSPHYTTQRIADTNDWIPSIDFSDDDVVTNYNNIRLQESNIADENARAQLFLSLLQNSQELPDDVIPRSLLANLLTTSETDHKEFPDGFAESSPENQFLHKPDDNIHAKSFENKDQTIIDAYPNSDALFIDAALKSATPEPIPAPPKYQSNFSNTRAIHDWAISPESLYARATGSFIGGMRTCSGTNFGGDYFITAAHCGDRVHVNDKATFSLGLMGTIDDRSNPYKLGIQYARNRLIDLGLPSHAVTQIIDSEKQLRATNNKRLPSSIRYKQHQFYCDQRWTGGSGYNNQQNEWRDIAVYQCQPNVFSYNLHSFGHRNILFSENFGLLPSHIYGQAYLASEALRSENSFPIATLGSNYLPFPYALEDKFPRDPKNNPFLVQQYVTQGKSIPARDSGRAKAPIVKKRAILHTGYVIPGTSGGLVMDPNTHQGIAIVSQMKAKSLSAQDQDGTAFDAWFTYSHTIPTRLQQLFTLPSPVYEQRFLTTNRSSSNFSSGTSYGSRSQLTCPPGFAAAGVVGSYLKGGRYNIGNSRRIIPDLPGNFGFVCLPFIDFTKKADFDFKYKRRKPTDIYSPNGRTPDNTNDQDVDLRPKMPKLNNTVPTHNFEQAVVISTGSLDTQLQQQTWSPTRNQSSLRPFDQYMSEVLSTQIFNRSYSLQQSFTMCPPGYYIQELWIASNGNVSAVEKILVLTCSKASSNQVVYRVPRGSIGMTSSSVNLSRSLVSNVACPKGSVIDGVTIDSDGYFTYRLRANCRGKS